MERKIAIYALLAKCMKSGLVVGLDLRPAQPAPVAFDVDRALSKLPPVHRCHCGCQ